MFADRHCAGAKKDFFFNAISSSSVFLTIELMDRRFAARIVRNGLASLCMIMRKKLAPIVH
jgi:hypothetical protein